MTLDTCVLQGRAIARPQHYNKDIAKYIDHLEGLRTTNTLTIVTKTNDLLDEVYDAIAQYPKSEKFALGADTKQSGLTFYKLIVTAAKKYYKKTTLKDADVELFVLKNFIRMGHSRRYMNTKRYERLSRAIEEVGRMLGGWIKATDK